MHFTSQTQHMQDMVWANQNFLDHPFWFPLPFVEYVGDNYAYLADVVMFECSDIKRTRENGGL